MILCGVFYWEGDILPIGYYALLVFLGGCSYGVLSTIVKSAYGAGLGVADVSGGQAFFGMCMLCLASLKWLKEGQDIKQAVILIICGIPMGLSTIFYYHSLETLSASMAIICLFQFVWMGTAVEAVFCRKLPHIHKIISIGLLLAGSVLGVGGEMGDGFSFSAGLVWGLLAAVSYASVIFVSGTVGTQVPPLLKSAWMSVGASVVVFLFLRPGFLADQEAFVSLLPYGLLLGFFGMAVPPFLFSVGIPRLGPGLGSILTASELPMAVFMACFVLGEEVSPPQWAGVGLILIGIIIGNKRA